MKVKSESEVSQLYPTLSDPMNCSLPGSSIHGIFQARVLAALFTIAKERKQLKCPSTDEWIKKRWYVYTHAHTPEYYSAIKRMK